MKIQAFTDTSFGDKSVTVLAGVNNGVLQVVAVLQDGDTYELEKEDEWNAQCS